MVVSVSDIEKTKEIFLDEKCLEYSYFSGQGAGGQNRNKVQNCLRLTHTGYNITVSVQGRKRDSNIRHAKLELLKRISKIENDKAVSHSSSQKKSNFGSGMRGDKTYTIRFQDDMAISHLTGKKMSAKKYMKGHMDLLW